MALDLVRCIFVVAILVLVQAARKKPLRLLPQKVECTSDAHLMANISCEMEPLPNGGANLTIAGTFVQDANQIWLKLQSYDKRGSKYQQGLVGTTIDLCDFNDAISKSFIKKFLETAVKDVSQYIHECPYRDAVLLDKIRFEGTMFLRILPMGLYRLDFRAYDANNGTYYHLKFYVAISNRY